MLPLRVFLLSVGTIIFEISSGIVCHTHFEVLIYLALIIPPKLQIVFQTLWAPLNEGRLAFRYVMRSIQVLFFLALLELDQPLQV